MAELRLRATLGLARVALQRGEALLCPALARRLDLTLALALTLALSPKPKPNPNSNPNPTPHQVSRSAA